MLSHNETTTAKFCTIHRLIRRNFCSIKGKRSAIEDRKRPIVRKLVLRIRRFRKKVIIVWLASLPSKLGLCFLFLPVKRFLCRLSVRLFDEFGVYLGLFRFGCIFGGICLCGCLTPLRFFVRLQLYCRSLLWLQSELPLLNTLTLKTNT
jgi:hypothetical protein